MSARWVKLRKHSARADVLRCSPKNRRWFSAPQKHFANQMLWKNWANDRLEPVMTHDVGRHLTMAQRRRIKVDFRLEGGPLAGCTDQVNDLGLDGLNISL